MIFASICTAEKIKNKTATILVHVGCSRFPQQSADASGSIGPCGRGPMMVFSHQARTFTSPALMAYGRYVCDLPGSAVAASSQPRTRVLGLQWCNAANMGTAHSPQPWGSAGHQTLSNILKETRERGSGRRQITSSDGSRLHHRVSKSSYDTGYYMPEEPALPLALRQNQTHPHSKSFTLIMHLIPV